MNTHITMSVLGNREEWLQHRTKYIGGSDVSAIVGLNQYKSNERLFLEKTGQREPEDISDKPYVQYGVRAEDHLRAMYALRHPEYTVHYKENNSFLNPKYPFAAASLDGWLTDQDGRTGVLEIKTTTILGGYQLDKWKGGIPDNYYCQVLFYMAVIEADFAELTAELRWGWDRDDCTESEIRTYHIERSEVTEDIRFLMDEVGKFWKHVKERKLPGLLLPDI